jgi:tRNA-dihydrouridine synthase C
MLSRNYPEAMLLFNEVRREHDCVRVDLLLGYSAEPITA